MTQEQVTIDVDVPAPPIAGSSEEGEMAGKGNGATAAATKKTTPKKGEKIVLTVASIVVDKDANPRKNFDRTALRELARSLKVEGLLNPVTVYYDTQDGKYHLIAGERRLRAAKLADIKKIDAMVAVIRKNDDDDGTIIGVRIAENLQRANLTPLEQARDVQQLLGKRIFVDDKFVTGTAKTAAAFCGVSPAWVSQRLALLDMPQEIQDAMEAGQIGLSQVRSLVPLSSAEKQLALFHEMTKDGKPDVAKAQRIVTRAQREGKATRKSTAQGKKRGRPAATGDAPSIRQSVEVAQERLRRVKIEMRKKQDIRQGLAEAYEKYDKARTDEKKNFMKGMISAMEWFAGFRETL